MAVDINAIRAKLNQFKNQGSVSASLWKPPEGKSTIRIVPWKENKAMPFVELLFHYFNGKTILSPTSYGRRDPIAEFAESLASSGVKEDWQQSRTFVPKLRTYVPVIVRGEEDKGVRWWSFGKTVYTELLAIMDDPDYGDITDVKSGRDIVVEHIPKNKSDTTFAKTSVRPKPKETPLADTVEAAKDFLSNQPDINALFEEPSYEKLKSTLEAYLDPDSPANEHNRDANNSEPVSATAQKSRETVKSSTPIDDMLDEFDEVFK